MSRIRFWTLVGLGILPPALLVVAVSRTWQTYTPSYPFDAVSTVDHFGRWWCAAAALVMLVANIAGMKLRRVLLLSAVTAIAVLIVSVLYLIGGRDLAAVAGPIQLRAKATVGFGPWLAVIGAGLDLAFVTTARMVVSVPLIRARTQPPRK